MRRVIGSVIAILCLSLSPHVGRAGEPEAWAAYLAASDAGLRSSAALAEANVTHSTVGQYRDNVSNRFMAVSGRMSQADRDSYWSNMDAGQDRLDAAAARYALGGGYQGGGLAAVGLGLDAYNDGRFDDALSYFQWASTGYFNAECEAHGGEFIDGAANDFFTAADDIVKKYGG